MMLVLLCQLGPDLYAIDVVELAEVIPMVTIHAVYGLPPIFAGQFSFGGTMLPAIDLCQLIAGKPAKVHLSTRIIVAKRNEEMIGLVAEQVTETMRIDGSTFQPTITGASPFVSGIGETPRGVVRLLELSAVLALAPGRAACEVSRT